MPVHGKMDISKENMMGCKINSFEISMMHQVPENTDLPISADFGIISRL
jgi:hypothetical protein